VEEKSKEKPMKYMSTDKKLYHSSLIIESALLCKKGKSPQNFLKPLSNSILKTKQASSFRPHFFPQNNEIQNNK